MRGASNWANSKVGLAIVHADRPLGNLSRSSTTTTTEGGWVRERSTRKLEVDLYVCDE